LKTARVPAGSAQSFHRSTGDGRLPCRSMRAIGGRGRYPWSVDLKAT
jgi:hypothetical protein